MYDLGCRRLVNYVSGFFLFLWYWLGFIIEFVRRCLFRIWGYRCVGIDVLVCMEVLDYMYIGGVLKFKKRKRDLMFDIF